jgi:hypothetical protein
MTLDDHTNTDYNFNNYDDIEDDETNRVPSTEYSDILETDQQPVGNLFK